MCYLVAKKRDAHGCFALKTRIGEKLAEMIAMLSQHVANKGIEIFIISRPTAYGEYAPYTIVEDEEVFKQIVFNMM